MDERTDDVAGHLAVAEPAGGVVAGEVLTVGREVAAYRRDNAVVVARVHDGVPEQEQRGVPRLFGRWRRCKRRRRRGSNAESPMQNHYRRRHDKESALAHHLRCSIRLMMLLLLQEVLQI